MQRTKHGSALGREELIESSVCEMELLVCDITLIIIKQMMLWSRAAPCKAPCTGFRQKPGLWRRESGRISP